MDHIRIPTDGVIQGQPQVGSRFFSLDKVLFRNEDRQPAIAAGGISEGVGTFLLYGWDARFQRLKCFLVGHNNRSPCMDLPNIALGRQKAVRLGFQKDVDNRYFNEYLRGGADAMDNLDAPVYPHAILVMDGDKDVRLPFPDELKDFYKDWVLSSRSQNLCLRLDESTMENLKTMGRYIQKGTGWPLEEIVNMYYYDTILKPRREAE